MKKTFPGILCAAVLLANVVFAQSDGSSATTAWRDGRFAVDVANVIGRSDIVLGQPNLKANRALPLGNGQLGIALWSDDGLTAQLNRADALPGRYSSGQIVVPGLSTLTSAKDYSGRLDLYNGAFLERGGGMTVMAYVQPDTDTLIIDVRGANPEQRQTAILKLWQPRRPNPSASNAVGVLSESWLDNTEPGASGRRFGTLSAISAHGRNVSAMVADPYTVRISFRPYADGHFTIVAAAPHYDGKGDPQQLVRRALLNIAPGQHKAWWNAFWHRANPIKITSADGSGEYMENLRAIYLFAAAAEKGGEIPGSQAGVADMFSAVQDWHHWDPASFWHWNLRMQVAANLGAGVAELNAPYFNLYRANLTNLRNWTTKHMEGRPGVCVPETMRFNGVGVQKRRLPPPAPELHLQQQSQAKVVFSSLPFALDCDAHFQPYYNARTLSTGAEVSLWIWRQYLVTMDRAFLERNYPVMADSARFLLAYEKLGPDGLLHTSPSNAHETQWDTTDPTTDIAAQLALYPATIQAAKLLGRDPDLIRQLKAALPKVPPLPRSQPSPPFSLLPPSADAGRNDVIAPSYLPAATLHNAENIGLEPVWPYDLIGDTSPLFALARRTYQHRPFRTRADWSFDPIQAARLDLGSEVERTLIKLTEIYQTAINGLVNGGEFYVEQTGVVATALQEAFVQDYDGVIRIAPAVPPGWDFDGSVSIEGNAKVDLQVRNGVATTLVIEAASTGPLRLRNPWPGQAVDIVCSSNAVALRNAAGPILVFRAVTHTKYLVEPSSAKNTSERFAPISGVPSKSARRLGNNRIGIPPAN